MRSLIALGLLACAALVEPAAAQNAARTPALPWSFYATKLQVRDMAVSLRFYSELLGMKLVPNDTPGHDNVRMLRFEDGKVRAPSEGPMLILNTTEGVPQIGSAYGAIVFITPDVDATVARIQAAGMKILQAPKHSGAFAVAYVQDPDGRPVELMQIGG